MRWVRDWCVWAAGWTLAMQTPVWLAVAVDARRQRTDPALEPMPVPSWVPDVAYVAALLVPLGLVLVVAGVWSTASRRTGLVLGAAGLAAGAVAFSGFPEGVVGSWYVGLTASASACALVVALTPVPDLSEAPPRSVLPGLALVASGLFLAFTCWRGGSYWDWRGGSALSYAVGLGASVLLVVLGATATRWAPLHSRVLRWLLVVLGLLGAVYLLPGVLVLFDGYGGALYRWEEDESPWSFGAPFLLIGTGMLAAAVASFRRRGDLVAWSLASGVTFSLLALWQESTWGSVMG
jgi:hypothetical protein